MVSHLFFLEHLQLLVWIKNGFNIISTRLLKQRVGQFGPETIGRKVKSEGSYILI